MGNIYRDGVSETLDGPITVSKTSQGHTVEAYSSEGVKRYYVTLKDSPYGAHGSTIAEAVADAIYKDPAQRPKVEELVSRIRKAGPERKVTLQEFRLITGACAEGCRIALKRAGIEGVNALTPVEIRDKVSKEWGEKLIRILERDANNNNFGGDETAQADQIKVLVLLKAVRDAVVKGLKKLWSKSIAKLSRAGLH